jgi:hypothetical protein
MLLEHRKSELGATSLRNGCGRVGYLRSVRQRRDAQRCYGNEVCEPGQQIAHEARLSITHWT